MDTLFFFLAILSCMVLMLSKAGGYTWNQVGWNTWEQTFPDGKWEFQAVWAVQFQSKQHFSISVYLKNASSCYRLPYFNTSCCYWKSVVTHVFKGKVKWCGWNFENPCFQLAVACTADWLVAFRSRLCLQGSVPIHSSRVSYLSLCGLRWAFQWLELTQVKNQTQIMEVPGGPKRAVGYSKLMSISMYKITILTKSLVNIWSFK